METTFEQETSRFIDILLNMRELSTLIDIKNYITIKKDELDYKGIDEYSFCKYEGKLDVLLELENLLLNKIITVKEKTI
jgi:hypothetical protein